MDHSEELLSPDILNKRKHCYKSSQLLKWNQTYTYIYIYTHTHSNITFQIIKSALSEQEKRLYFSKQDQNYE